MMSSDALKLRRPSSASTSTQVGSANEPSTDPTESQNLINQDEDQSSAGSHLSCFQTRHTASGAPVQNGDFASVPLLTPEQNQAAIRTELASHFDKVLAAITPENLHDVAEIDAIRDPAIQFARRTLHANEMRAEMNAMITRIAAKISPTHDLEKLKSDLNNVRRIDEATQYLHGVSGAAVFNGVGTLADLMAPAGIKLLQTTYSLSEKEAKYLYTFLATFTVANTDFAYTPHIQRAALGSDPYYTQVSSLDKLDETYVKFLKHYAPPAKGIMGKTVDLNTRLAGYNMRNAVVIPVDCAAPAMTTGLGPTAWEGTVGMLAAGPYGQQKANEQKEDVFEAGTPVLFANKALLALLEDASRGFDPQRWASGAYKTLVAPFLGAVGATFVPQAKCPSFMGGPSHAELDHVTTPHRIMPGALANGPFSPTALTASAVLGASFAATSAAKDVIANGEPAPQSRLKRIAIDAAGLIGKMLAYAMFATGATTVSELTTMAIEYAAQYRPKWKKNEERSADAHELLERLPAHQAQTRSADAMASS